MNRIMNTNQKNINQNNTDQKKTNQNIHQHLTKKSPKQN